MANMVAPDKPSAEPSSISGLLTLPWDVYASLLGKATREEHDSTPPKPLSDDNVVERIANLETEIESVKLLRDRSYLTYELLTQYKTAVDHLEKLVANLETRLSVQQKLAADLQVELSRQATRFQMESENQRKAALERDEREKEYRMEIIFLWNKLAALEQGPGQLNLCPNAGASDESRVTDLKPDIVNVPVDSGQRQSSTIYAVIDGDGNIFSGDLLKRGFQGGVVAAQLLTDELISFYRQNILSKLKNDTNLANIPRVSPAASGAKQDIQLWLYIFLNYKRLQHILLANEVCTGIQYDKFMAGFTQYNPRFIICNVYSGKDATGMKVREHLLEYTRQPTVGTVFFGGSHDSGYCKTLETLQNEGLLPKVVLLPGYRNIHWSISSFPLAEHRIDGLFMKERLPGDPGPEVQYAQVGLGRITRHNAISRAVPGLCRQ